MCCLSVFLYLSVFFCYVFVSSRRRHTRCALVTGVQTCALPIYPFNLDDQLTDDERMIRDSARAYAQEKLQPRVIEAYANEHTDPELFREMGAQGLLGATVPEKFGGAAASYVAYGLIAREVERVDGGHRAVESGHTGPVN